MCGIVGLIDFSALKGTKKQPKGCVTADLITKMRDVMHHRGPDGAGEYINKTQTAGFGHRRLSIIDLAASANQPMTTDDLTLVFNGEIYNHAELRTELTALGVTHWHTSHSDTEVLLKAWQYWGEACLPKLRGMFAFAIWNNSVQTLTLVRDRIGVKPLYFAETDGKLTFASEIKALLQTPWQKRSINDNGLFHYLSFLTVPAPETLFDGIYKLPAGSLVQFGADIHNHGEIREWWNPLKAAEKEAFTPDPETAVLNRLQDAVADRKVADVDVGVLLSGGIDSSTNVALFSEMGQKPVKTFCIGYDTNYKSAPNEFAPAAEVAQKFNTTHHERHLTMPEVLHFLPEMVWLQDEPIADPVCVPVYFVSEEARKNGVTVAQVGEGADELFFGYRNWRAKWWLQKCANITPACLWRMGAWLLTKANKDHTRLHDVLHRAAQKQPVFWGGVDIFTEAEKHRLLSPALQQKFANRTSWDAIAPYYNTYTKTPTAKNAKTAGWMTFIDLKLRLPELLLMRLDKMCMGVGLEGRVPFLDHRLVSLALSLPERSRMHPKRLKPLLKNIAANFLPHHIIHRRKQGFALPVHEWFFTEMGDEARRKINTFIATTNLLNPTAVNAIFNRQDHQKAWYILNLALWWEQYIAPEIAPTCAPSGAPSSVPTKKRA